MMPTTIELNQWSNVFTAIEIPQFSDVGGLTMLYISSCISRCFDLHTPPSTVFDGSQSSTL